MSRDEDLRLGFMCGFLIAMAIYSLLQDTFGQERYLRLVAENWIPGWITVPLALVVVLSCYWIYFRRRRDIERRPRRDD